jgi:hypothetical protein
MARSGTPSQLDRALRSEELCGGTSARAKAAEIRSAPAQPVLCGGQRQLNILLYNPDNEVTNNFMPHLWMFLLKSLTPPGHEVFLLDGNARRMTEPEVVQ